ncbi:hypothetical protein CIB84_012839, partial [Bambusicola thoracicus]
MAEEARAAVRHDWPKPLQLERGNLLTARRRWLRRTLQCGVPLQRLLVVARLREEVAAEEVAALLVNLSRENRQLTCWDSHCERCNKLFLLKQGYHRGLFEAAPQYCRREEVSGLLLLSSSQVLHVVESCSSTTHFLIRALASLQNQGP